MLTTLTNYLHIPINFIKQPWNHRIGKVKKKKKRKSLCFLEKYIFHSVIMKRNPVTQMEIKRILNVLVL